MNLNEYKLNFSYKYNNNSYTIHGDDERVKFTHDITDKGIKFFFKSSVKIEVISAELVYQHYFDIESKFFHGLNQENMELTINKMVLWDLQN